MCGQISDFRRNVQKIVYFAYQILNGFRIRCDNSFPVIGDANVQFKTIVNNVW